MTVKRYFVYGSFAGVNKTIYHSSTYAALTDAEYAQIVKEAVEASEMKKKEIDELYEGAVALSNISADNSDGTAQSDTSDVLNNKV